MPHAVNQLSFHKGFSPQQWVFGKVMTHVHGLSGELFNPGQEALDEQGVFAEVQQRRAAAAKAFIAADSDAKLRRAFTQKFQEQKGCLVVGQQCWYWRNAGAGILRKARWRGLARVVAIEDNGDARVHGTSLVRCAPQQVRPLVEDSGAFVPIDRAAAMKDLEELKARSTTQFRDEMKRAGIEAKDMDFYDWDGDLEADYQPEEMDPEDNVEQESDREHDALPGIVRAIMPQQQHEERERTPRRGQQAVHGPPSDAPTAIPADQEMEKAAEGSPKRKKHEPGEERPAKNPRGEASAAPPPEAVPVPTDDELVIDEVFVVANEGASLSEGWKLVDGSFELDEVYVQQNLRRGEVSMHCLTPDEQAEFVNSKCKELEQYFQNMVWEFATEQESQKAINTNRVITARWVLTWKRINEDNPDEAPRYKAKARLVLRGFEDPDLLNIKTAAPTTSRLSRLFLLSITNWNQWELLCGDVKAAFLSGSGFDRVIIVKLPKDCNPLIGGDQIGPEGHIYMKLKKSAYGLADAPLMWYREASSRLMARGWRNHPLDQCCFILSEKVKGKVVLVGMLVIHVDDILITGNPNNERYKQAIQCLKADFNFGKWERLSQEQPIKYCGGQIYKTKYGIEVSYAEYMKKLCLITVNKGHKPSDEMSPSETGKYRALIGALQWPSSQGMPMLAASVSLQAGAVPKGSVQDVVELNKTLRFGKSQSDVTIKFLARPNDETNGAINNLDNMTLVCYADAGFGTRRDGASQGGFIIMACDKSVHNGNKVPASTIAWRSFKLPRVCKSSLGAECQATATALEELLMAKTFLEALKKPDSDLKNIKDHLTGVSAMVTDCKVLYDAVYRETIQQATDKRVAIEGLVIKENLKDLNCSWRWVSSERQLADGLTKISARQTFAERYRGPDTYQAAKKKSQDERRKTVQETRMTPSRVAETLVGLVMSSQVVSAATKEEQCKTDIDHVTLNIELFDMGVIMVIIMVMLGLVMLAWLMCKHKNKKKENEDSEEEPVPELEPADHGEENDVMGNIVNELVAQNEALQTQVKEQERKISHLMALLQKHDKKETGVATFSHVPEEVLTTPTGACAHLRINCHHLGKNHKKWRVCKDCGR